MKESSKLAGYDNNMNNNQHQNNQFNQGLSSQENGIYQQRLRVAGSNERLDTRTNRTKADLAIDFLRQ